MALSSEYELKFHLYNGNEQDVDSHFNQYTNLRDIKKEEGNVSSKVLSYFFEGLIALVNGDISFWKDDNKTAYDHYSEALRMFTRFKNSRNSNERLDKLAERYIYRVNGLIKLTNAIIAKDNKMKQNLFAESLKNFNQEVALSNEMNEQMASYASFARASFVESQILLLNSLNIQKEDSVTAKKELMKARGSIRQSAFINPRFIPYIEIVEENLDSLTRSRLLIKAEKYADLATISSENGEYIEARKLFKKAVLFHNRASNMASDTATRRKLLSTAALYEASVLEAEANNLFRRENNTAEAAVKYEDAAKQVDRAIALMGHFGSKELINGINCQSTFFKAMKLQSQAISEFDNENYKESRELFEKSLELFNRTKGQGKQSKNLVIMNMAEEAIADVNGYISMVDAII